MAHDYFKSIKSLFGRAAERDAWEVDRERFFIALRKDDLATVMSIAQTYPNECVKWESKKGSPLAMAQSNGSLKVFRFLLEQGANANENLGNDWTPLHQAVKKKQYDFAVALVDHHADLNTKALVKVKEVCYSDYEFYDTPLTLSIKNNDKLMMIMLLERGADASISPGRRDLSPIKLATKRGKYVLADLCKRAPILRQNYQQAQRAAQAAQTEAHNKMRESGLQKDVKIELRFSTPPKGR